MLYNTAERPSSATFAELVESLCLETRLFLFLTVALIFPKEVRCSKLLRVFGGPDVVTTSRGPEGSLHMNRKPNLHPRCNRSDTRCKPQVQFPAASLLL